MLKMYTNHYAMSTKCIHAPPFTLGYVYKVTGLLNIYINFSKKKKTKPFTKHIYIYINV